MRKCNRIPFLTATLGLNLFVRLSIIMIILNSPISQRASVTDPITRKEDIGAWSALGQAGFETTASTHPESSLEIAQTMNPLQKVLDVRFLELSLGQQF